MTTKGIARIKTIKRAHEKQWLAIDGVVAVGIGVTSSGREGVIVSVMGNEEKIRALIPSRIETVEIDIQTTGTLTAF